MKSIPLKDVNWFSFSEDYDNEKVLTIWQAVAFVLNDIDAFKHEVPDFMDEMTSLEKEIADNQVINPKGQGYDLHEVIDTSAPDFDFENFLVPDYDLKHDLISLNVFRREIVYSMGVPYTIIYELLGSELTKNTSREKHSLRIIAKDTEGIVQHCFRKTDLQNWKSVSLLNDLGIFQSIEKSNRKVRDDKIENQKIISGMLIHLLSEQPLFDKRNLEAKFTKGQGGSNINYSKIYNYFNDKYLPNDASNFPQERTVTDFLKSAYRSFKEGVKLL